MKLIAASAGSGTAAAAATNATTATRRDKLRLGDVLLAQRLISEEQLAQALDLQNTSGRKLGRVLIERGALTEEALAHALARQLRAPVVNLNSYPLKGELVRQLGEAAARRHRAIVLDDRGDHLLVAFSDPLDLTAHDDVARLLKRSIQVAVVPESQLTPAFDRHYRRTDEISGLAKALEKDIGDAVDFGALQESVGQEGAPVVRLLQSVFEDAMMIGASDVHLEPQENELLIRSRIDGVLQTQTQADKRIAGALTQRLKLMANLDISEKRLPQDGRFTLRLRGRTVDVRLSTLPSQYGESVVMRLLGQGSEVRRLDEIGMPADMLARFRALLGRSTGTVLVTGPTGSGKTTTLYAALAELDASSQKIITVEDPVEYRLPGLTQVQVNDKIDLSFARVLRATLRQDPDVILVGEMRDTETAEIGLRAAITGHLVLSTLHTRDAASTPYRLLDMGVPPFMVATALQAVVAQRLVRRNCSQCARLHDASPQEAAWLGLMTGDGALATRRGRGCLACNGTGYAGRLGVYEMLEMDAALAQTATHGDPATFLAAARARMHGRTLAHRAADLVRAGQTSVAEAMRLTSEFDTES
ncbi:GspE/PulE family protein [Rhizobacter sp. SG703]|uniref:GspE/PulE family protein n=1 Tax=Rhizobacter sp. SG703 TaxID=2587140 RepID=UPI001445CA37|nr:GspE/PulE family protein [Rhizobacter sp. SG703]NKI92755.1 MSHA biogenesis protein MshE [Rhizobacter sp. SG703]